MTVPRPFRPLYRPGRPPARRGSLSCPARRLAVLVLWFVLAAVPASAQLTLGQVEHDRAQMDALRAGLDAAAPFAVQPTMTVLSPGRSGGIEGSVRTAEHDRSGALRVAPGAQLWWLAQLAPPQSRLDLAAQPQLHLLRVTPSSDVAVGASAALLELEVEAAGRTARIDSARRAVDAIPAADLAFALGSDHEHVYDAEDWMVFDLLRESIELRLCDDLSAQGVTTCHDAFAQLTRRPNAPQRYQIKIGCLDPCGEALINLDARYFAGRLDTMSAVFLIGDPRFDIGPELEVRFRSPAAPGLLSARSSGRLVVSPEQTVGAATIDWTLLYQDAHPSRLDPNADRSP